MLYQVGSVQFTAILGLNTHEYERRAGGDYAAKDVIGALRPQEPVGEGDDVLRLLCKVYAQAAGRAYADMDALDQMRMAQQTVICVRGDGYNLGWRVITELNERGRKLDGGGRGKIIEFDIALRKVPPPSSSGLLTMLYSIAPSGLARLFDDLLG